jgi:hypothetical protein
MDGKPTLERCAAVVTNPIASAEGAVRPHIPQTPSFMKAMWDTTSNMFHFPTVFAVGEHNSWLYAKQCEYREMHEAALKKE